MSGWEERRAARNRIEQERVMGPEPDPLCCMEWRPFPHIGQCCCSAHAATERPVSTSTTPLMARLGSHRMIEQPIPHRRERHVRSDPGPLMLTEGWAHDARHLLRVLDIPAAVAGFGWLEPDPDPFPASPCGAGS